MFAKNELGGLSDISNDEIEIKSGEIEDYDVDELMILPSSQPKGAQQQ